MNAWCKIVRVVVNARKECFNWRALGEGQGGLVWFCGHTEEGMCAGRECARSCVECDSRGDRVKMIIAFALGGELLLTLR